MRLLSRPENKVRRLFDRKFLYHKDYDLRFQNLRAGNLITNVPLSRFLARRGMSSQNSKWEHASCSLTVFENNLQEKFLLVRIQEVMWGPFQRSMVKDKQFFRVKYEELQEYRNKNR